MSVVKSRRSKSKVEFEMLYFTLANNVDNMVENCFFADVGMIDRNRVFLDVRCRTLERLSDNLLYYIKIANSIFPQCNMEWEERRVSIDKAIGTCFAILTNYQRIMMRLKVRDDKYNNDILTIMHMINSLKSWRKSDNKLKGKFANK